MNKRQKQIKKGTKVKATDIHYFFPDLSKSGINKIASISGLSPKVIKYYSRTINGWRTIAQIKHLYNKTVGLPVRF